MDTRIVIYNGRRWLLSGFTRTSDGFILANGVMLRGLKTGVTVQKDGDGWPIYHHFFLGR